jgi:hypothetical protein
MNFFGGSKTATLSPAKLACFEVTGDTAIAPAPVRRRPGRAVFGALLLGLIGAIGFNVYVFSHPDAHRNTPSYGFSDIHQIYSQGQTLDEQRPARLD